MLRDIFLFYLVKCTLDKFLYICHGWDAFWRSFISFIHFAFIFPEHFVNNK